MLDLTIRRSRRVTATPHAVRTEQLDEVSCLPLEPLGAEQLGHRPLHVRRQSDRGHPRCTTLEQLADLDLGRGLADALPHTGLFDARPAVLAGCLTRPGNDVVEQALLLTNESG